MQSAIVSYKEEILQDQANYDKNMAEIAEVEKQIGHYCDSYSLAARLTPVELKEEGKTLDHCVGGYSNKCILGDSHIVSVVETSSGKPISTIEFVTNDNSLYIGKHDGHKSSKPPLISKLMEIAFFKMLDSEEIVIDYKALQNAKKERIASAKTLEQIVVQSLGFDPLDSSKIKQLSVVCAEMVSKNGALESRFKDVKSISEIQLPDDLKIGEGLSTISLLPAKQETKPKTLTAPVTAEQLSSNIQKAVDKLFGENVVKVTIQQKSNDRFGEVVLEKGNSDCDLEKITSLLAEKLPEKTKLVLQDNKIHIEGMKPKPLSDILLGVAQLR